MQQFVPFEDEWEALDRLGPDALRPYHVDRPCAHALRDDDARGSYMDEAGELGGY